MVGRLFQIVYLLMENEHLSARELADRLEVSVRTINRDIEKLSEARIPIYTTRGRDGGVSLLPDSVLNKKVLLPITISITKMIRIIFHFFILVFS